MTTIKISGGVNDGMEVSADNYVVLSIVENGDEADFRVVGEAADQYMAIFAVKLLSIAESLCKREEVR